MADSTLVPLCIAAAIGLPIAGAMISEFRAPRWKLALRATLIGSFWIFMAVAFGVAGGLI